MLINVFERLAGTTDSIYIGECRAGGVDGGLRVISAVIYFIPKAYYSKV